MCDSALLDHPIEGSSPRREEEKDTAAGEEEEEEQAGGEGIPRNSMSAARRKWGEGGIGIRSRVRGVSSRWRMGMGTEEEGQSSSSQKWD